MIRNFSKARKNYWNSEKNRIFKIPEIQQKFKLLMSKNFFSNLNFWKIGFQTISIFEKNWTSENSEFCLLNPRITSSSKSSIFFRRQQVGTMSHGDHPGVPPGLITTSKKKKKLDEDSEGVCSRWPSKWNLLLGAALLAAILIICLLLCEFSKKKNILSVVYQFISYIQVINFLQSVLRATCTLNRLQTPRHQPPPPPPPPIVIRIWASGPSPRLSV